MKLLDIFVLGTPRPKGSMRHVGHGRMVEQHGHSTDWRTTIVQAAHDAVSHAPDDPWTRVLLPGYPHTGPVAVTVELRFTKPKSAPKTKVTYPSTRSTGDSDKQARNVLDALQDAGVFKDDAQVVDLIVFKRYAEPNQMPGARITVEPVGPVT
jgi:crossover junction endodeoxyribonuclease RusA